MKKRAIAGIVDREVLDRLKREQGEVEERDQAPLSFGLIQRLFSFTAPYKRKMGWLMFFVLARALQMPVLAWAVGAIINGPVAHGDESALWWWVGGFLGFAIVTEITFAFRIKLALEIGEAVIRDVRAALFQHWLRLTMSYFNANPVGRWIRRLTGDAENIRVGVQNVLFVSLVQVGQMIGCAIFMVLQGSGSPPPRARHGAGCLGARSLLSGTPQAKPIVSKATATAGSPRPWRKASAASGSLRASGRGEVNAGLFRDPVADHARINFVAARTSGTFLPLLELRWPTLHGPAHRGGWLAGPEPGDRHAPGQHGSILLPRRLILQPDHRPGKHVQRSAHRDGRRRKGLRHSRRQARLGRSAGRSGDPGFPGAG